MWDTKFNLCKFFRHFSSLLIFWIANQLARFRIIDAEMWKCQEQMMWSGFFSGG